MHSRLNITLLKRTLRLLDRVAKRGDQSRLIAAAIERCVEEVGRKKRDCPTGDDGKSIGRCRSA